MNKYFTAITNSRGDSLEGYRVQVVDSTGAAVDVFADQSSTRFTDATGAVVNYASSTGTGKVEFYWTAAVGQTLQVFDTNGSLVDSTTDFADYYTSSTLVGNIAQSQVTGLTTDLAAKETTVSLAGTNGAARVGFSGAETYTNGTVGAALKRLISINDAPYNASPSSTGAQNSAAFNAAIADMAAAGGGEIWTRDPGTYLLDDTNSGAASWDNRRCIYVNTDNIALRFGRGVVLKLADNQDAHVIQIGSRTTEVLTVDNVLIEGVSIDGNRANQTAPSALLDHNIGIAVQSDCTNITIRDFDIRQCMYYGIGFQRQGFVDCSILNGVVEDSGADGIDCKDNQQDSRGNQIRGVKVRRHGLASATIDPTQAGINTHGGWLVSDVEVTEFAGDKHGIRYQVSTGDLASDHTSGLSNFYVEASSVGTTVGVRVNIPNADEARVGNGRVRGCAIGVDAAANFTSLVDITALDCTLGFDLYQRNQGTNLKAIDCTTGASFEEDNSVLMNFQARNCTTAIQFGANATFNAVRGGIVSGATTKVSDLSGGATNAVSEVTGINTDRRVSTTFPVTSTGRQIMTIAHGLDATPDVLDCIPYVARETAISDAQYSAPEVLSVDATNLSVDIDVLTASSTSGATARLVVRALAMKANGQ